MMPTRPITIPGRLAALLCLAMLLSAPAAAAGTAAAAGAAAPARIVAMEWAAAETLLALGIVPAAIADAPGYRAWVGHPELPAGVADIGLRQEPNLEELARLEPDLILSHAHLLPLKEKLAAIAPVQAVTFNGTGGDTFAAILSGTREIGRLTGRSAAAERLIDETREAFDRDAEKLRKAGLAGRHVYFVRLVDANTLRIHGKNSVAATVLSRLGLVDAYAGDVNEWGFALSEPSALAGDTDAAILVAGPVGEEEMARVFDTPLGRALPASRAKAVRRLSVTWTFGGLVSAVTMADAITEALTEASP
ncbi:ABC transporter substrate-binding protein [Jiella sonneratiae]|uniref:ABC transporter substrate-binding protein n=1 Tax=Jiella sonneratiae TaxID=2816856 RepID=A0ABS3J3G7_9HYPH|nr:ABC transporter substrate-binding protein [Jiella sonneratiae]MBO0903131.1 ABC transporter substrate-binding protein [Jiella sonneratiae]